jgi:GAF domain-containing protein
LSRLKDLLPGINAELRSKDPFPIRQILQVLKPIEQLAGEHGKSLDAQLAEILRGVLAACNINPAKGEGIGTIHLYDAETHVLRLSGYHGPMLKSIPEQYKRHDVASGHGIIAWVALKQQALHIPDIASSPFQKLHIQIMDGASSELALPMIVGQELVGVLNVEGVKGKLKNTSPLHVRSIWHAANHAAIAFCLSREAERASKKAKQAEALLRICCDVHAKSEGPPLGGLAKLASECLHADRCDLWSYEKATRQFEAVDASYPEFNAKDPPRDEGWSNYIRNTRQLLWFDGFKGHDEFRVMAWHRESRTWEQISTDMPRPGCVSHHLLRHGVRGELGLPINLGEDCLGVAWLKFIEQDHPPPTSDDIDVAVGFAAETARVLLLFQTEAQIAGAQREGMTLLLRVLRHEVLGKVMDKMVWEMRKATGPDALLRIQQDWPVLLEFVQSVVESLRWYDPKAPATASLTNVIVPKDLCLRALVNQAIELADIVQSEPSCRNLVDVSLIACVDGRFVRLLLFNLLQNAKKFTPYQRKDEPIRVSAELTRDAQGNSNVCISVEDAGDGIDAALVPRLGKELGVHRDPPGRVVSGGGFGLYLCSLIARAHGGQMLPPRPGRRGGACLEFLFPARKGG